MISIAEAHKLILDRVKLLPAQRVPLENAFSSFLAQDILSDRPIPPFNRVTMDGFAVKSSDFMEGAAKLKIVGTVAAGDAEMPSINKGETVRIMTGASMPFDADAVVKVEQSTTDGNLVYLKEDKISPGLNVALCGEDAKQGTLLINAGTYLTPPVVAVCASVGVTPVSVYSKPDVSVLSTGSEVIAAEQFPHPAQIRDCNSYSIRALSNSLGIKAKFIGTAPDSENELAAAIKQGMQSKVFLLSGGVSMGEFDFIPKILTKFGVEQVFHKVKIRPGKPIWFGQSKNGNFVFGLPGNPVSVMVNFKLFVEPLIRKMSGDTTPLPQYLTFPLHTDIHKPNDLEYFMPAKYVRNGNYVSVQLINYHGSGDYFGASLSDGLLRFPSERNHLAAKEIVDFLPW